MNRTVKTNYPVAFDSPDHINPWGTKKDLSRQLRFENKLYQYMEYKKFNKIMRKELNSLRHKYFYQSVD